MVNLDKKILKTLFNSRDSATFCELEKLMGDSDKQLLNEDDTFSFEAMECRYDDFSIECQFCRFLIVSYSSYITCFAGARGPK